MSEFNEYSFTRDHFEICDMTLRCDKYEAIFDCGDVACAKPVYFVARCRQVTKRYTENGNEAIGEKVKFCGLIAQDSLGFGVADNDQNFLAYIPKGAAYWEDMKIVRSDSEPTFTHADDTDGSGVHL